KEIFHNEPSVRKNVMRQFEKDCIELAGDPRPVLLSFTTDCYQQLDETERLTRRAIQLLHANNLQVSILSKGGKRSERDFDLLAANPELSSYGATLTFVDDALAKQYEPNAAPTSERITALKKAHEMGIPTWASLEPVWTPEDAFELIKSTHEFVDLFKVGKLNYHPQQKETDWKQFAGDVVELLDSLGANYYIKDDLKRYL
ncbi:hypothetical protein KA005_84460, partial [bacterium]|nr:hypothetical protein [bacterium]